ncbi:MAG: hypothetical protein RR612_04060, partial [Oscillospiraceae bacterium]
DIISKIVNFILWQFCRIFILMGKAVDAFSRIIRGMADRVAPKKPDFKTAVVEEIHSFVLLYNRSFIKKSREILGKTENKMGDKKE